jgi:hypothetical protein
MESDWEFKALETFPELKDQINNNRLGQQVSGSSSITRLLLPTTLTQSMTI